MARRDCCVKMSVQDFDATLTRGGYGGLRRLSPAAELLLASVNIYDYFVWQNNNGAELTPEQRETIDLRNAEAQYQLITEETDMPIGTVLLWLGKTIPEYALPLNGGTYQRVDYPDLYALLVDNLIVDADRFIVPNMSDAFPRGAVGTPATGLSGGSNSVTITESNLPPHNHTYQIRPQVPFGVTPGPSPIFTTGAVSIVPTGSTGGGAPVTVRPKNTTYRYVIVAR